MNAADIVTLPPVDVLAVLDATIDDLRTSGHTGCVENLLDARCAIEDLLHVLEARGLHRGADPELRAVAVRCLGGAA